MTEQSPLEGKWRYKMLMGTANGWDWRTLLEYLWHRIGNMDMRHRHVNCLSLSLCRKRARCLGSVVLLFFVFQY